MATDQDLTIRNEDDRARYDRMKDTIFGGDFYDDTIPTMVIAAILFMDEDAGVHQEDDRIVMVPGFAVWLPMMVTFTDPVLASISASFVSSDEDDGNEDEEQQPTDAEVAEIEARTKDWFEIKFEMDGVEYPSNVAGKTIWVKVVDDEELGDCFCASVRAADGTIVKLPHQVDTRSFR